MTRINVEIDGLAHPTSTCQWQDQYIAEFLRAQGHMQFQYLGQFQAFCKVQHGLFPFSQSLLESHFRSFCNNALNASFVGNDVVSNFPHLQNLAHNLRAQFVQPILNFCNGVKLRREAVNVSVIENVHFSSPCLQNQYIANLRCDQGEKSWFH